MSLVDLLAGDAEPCTAFEQCLNRPSDNGCNPCRDCKYAARLGGLFNRWVPARKGKKHPAAVRATRARKLEVVGAKAEQKRSRDRDKMEVLRRARRAEKETEHKIIQATRNSGRSNRDGDHTLAGMITLDTKLQMTVYNPIIRNAEVAKVRDDARRAGNNYGALVIRSRDGSGYVVMAEEDFASLVRGLC